MGKFLMILGASIITCLGFLSFGYPEEQITITTYYPSPYGSYQELNVNNSLALGPNSRAGLNALSDTSGAIYSTGAGGGYYFTGTVGGNLYRLYSPIGDSVNIWDKTSGTLVSLSPDDTGGLNFIANRVNFKNDDGTPATIRAGEVIYCVNY